jgi:chromosome partitioning protein
MKTIGIYNIKGGVGKTAASVNLSYLASRDGYKTLLWDLDPQGSSTFYFNKKQGIDTSTKKVITGKSPLEEIIIKTDYPKLSMIPSDFSFRNMDIKLDDVKHPKKRLADILSELKNEFDLVFLDCPPGISLLSENVFHAAGIILVPTIPTPLSQRTYGQIINFFVENDIPIKNIMPFFSMVEIRKNIHKQSIEELSKNIPNIFKTFIPYLSDVEKMGIFKKPVPVFKPSSKAAAAYIELWKEISTHL